MKLATYRDDASPQPGFAIDDRLVSLGSAYRAAAAGVAPASRLEFAERGANGQPALAQALAVATANADGPRQADVDWLPPTRGYKILAMAINSSAVSKLASVVARNPPFFSLEPGGGIPLGTAATGRCSLRELDLPVWNGLLAIEIEGTGRIGNPIYRIDREARQVRSQAPNPANQRPPRCSAGTLFGRHMMSGVAT